jgi:uridylate kinase
VEKDLARCRRVLLKLSGEALAGKNGETFCRESCLPILLQIGELLKRSISVAVVIGGGNVYRGRNCAFSSETGDRMGMVATIINGLALREFCEQLSLPCLLQSAYPIPTVGPMDSLQAKRALTEGVVVIFCGGTGLPHFSTDTAAALRAIDIGADLLLKASSVDGVYDSDPKKNPKAVRLEHISYGEAIANGLTFMDTEALCLLRRHGLRTVLFSMDRPGALEDVIDGKNVGTSITVV